MTISAQPAPTSLRHPFYADGDGVNRPTSPDKHPNYALFASSGSGIVPIVRTVNGRQIEAKLICRHSDVKEVLRNPVFSRAEARIADDPDVSGTILAMDGEQHAHVRAIVKDAFTKPATARLSDMIASNAAVQLDVMMGLGHRAELASDYAVPLTLGIICDMLGVPDQDRASFQEWGQAFLGTSDLTRDQAAAAAESMGAYLAQQLSRRQSDPQDDLMSRIATAGDRHSLETLVKLALALIVGGWETSAGSIARFVYVLLTRPYGGHDTAWDHLVARPDDIDSAITELERLYSTTAGDDMPRYVTEDFTLPSGGRLRQGEIVIPSHDAANRDPRVFPEPERMDFTRDPNPHLSFGYGMHYCIGVHLGGLEVRTAMRLLLRRLPGLRLGVPSADVRWKHGQTLTSPVALPVVW
ncbi:cytochrome P450 [Actinoallomurus iriomotensis]|uniref:Cytochrome P450 n=1 Tax=Actinoallomurus iriomotensis TaxID=478107 RepID=A0A9W6VUH6_9ACTN|nr:cytochrome P450 [Actinoallomurus iriomotensis]GLY85613.1 cytochrome P450 [Actinoallomurus iriomotensis]